MNSHYISIDDMIRSVQREIAMRRRTYGKLVSQERMSGDMADHELACMEAILDHLERFDGRREESLL